MSGQSSIAISNCVEFWFNDFSVEWIK